MMLREWPNSYASVIVIMFYLESNTILDISSDDHQCAWFTNNTKASHEMDVNRICCYLQITKDNGIVFNAYFAVLWVHGNAQDPIFARSITGFVVTFSNCPLLWV